MTDWRDDARRGDWRLIVWELLETDIAANVAAQRELLDLVKGVVPIADRVNLMERVRRHDTPREAKARAIDEAGRRGLLGREATEFIDNAVAAAQMLAGLSALYDEEPDWMTVAEDVFIRAVDEGDQQESGRATDAARDSVARQALGNGSGTKAGSGALGIEGRRPGSAEDRRANEREPTASAASASAPELSRRAHAQDGLDLIKAYRNLEAHAASTTDDPEETAWLHDWMRQAAAHGYAIGRHTQAVWGKPIEELALKAEATRQGLAKTRESRRDNTLKRMAPAMDKMHALIVKGMSLRNAATRVSQDYVDKTAGITMKGFSPGNLAQHYERMQKSALIRP